MKTIKQKFSHSKLAMLALLLSAIILLISGVFLSKKVSAEEATFSEDNFAMCNGAEVRTDGKDGIRFVASLGKALPSETTYENLTYNVMIVPKAYITKYSITDDYYTALQSALQADESVTNKTIVTMQAKPFQDEQVEGDAEKYYIRGTLSNVKYDNINVEWFGMAYLTYTNAGETQYVYAKIPEAGANVRSLVYCASGYLNRYDYTEKPEEKEILMNFVAQGINKGTGVVDEVNKNDRTYLNGGIQAIQDSQSDQVDLLPAKTETWSTGVPNGVKLHVVYGAEENTYASINENGVITGVEGDGVKATTKNVTMKVLGETYIRPVHVYKVTAELPEKAELFSAELEVNNEKFENSATLSTAQVDGEDVADVDWSSTDATVATVSEGTVTAQKQEWFVEAKTTTVSYSFELAGETFTSNECIVQVSFPIAYQENPKAYGDLIQKVYSDDATSYTTPNEAINTEALGANFGTVTAFYSEDLSKNLLVEEEGAKKTNANMYGEKEAGEKSFIVVSENGYAYKVNATVVNYAIKNAAQLNKFFDSYSTDTATLEDVTAYASYGMNVVLNDDVSTATTAGMHYYAGTLDGRGHTITYTGDALTTKQGFLGVALAESGTVKNTAFVGLKSGSQAQAAGLIKAVYGVVDNCYVDVEIGHASRAQGGVCWVLFETGKVKNTIVKTTVATGIDTVSGKGTICNDNRNGVIENCYSIGVEGKIVNNYVKLNKEDGTDNTNVTFTAGGLKALIGTALPASYNSYWTFTDTELKFGNTPLLTFTAS